MCRKLGARLKIFCRSLAASSKGPSHRPNFSVHNASTRLTRQRLASGNLLQRPTTIRRQSCTHTQRLYCSRADCSHVTRRISSLGTRQRSLYSALPRSRQQQQHRDPIQLATITIGLPVRYEYRPECVFGSRERKRRPSREISLRRLRSGGEVEEE